MRTPVVKSYMFLVTLVMGASLKLWLVFKIYVNRHQEKELDERLSLTKNLDKLVVSQSK